MNDSAPMIPSHGTNIVFISDEKYAHATGISIKSLLRCSCPDAIHVVSVGMNAAQETWLATLSPSIRILPLPQWGWTWLEQFRMHGDEHVSRTTYVKLLLHRLFPSLDRVLYLDGDVLILRDPQDLYEIDMQGGMIGATCNILAMHSEQKRLSLPNPYFNAGVLLCPLQLWRAENVESAFCGWYSEHLDVMRYDDQDIFNGVFSERTRWIDKRWNVSHYEIFAEHRLLQLEGEECGIVHFNGANKPWNDDYHLRWGMTELSFRAARRLLDGLNIEEGRALCAVADATETPLHTAAIG